MLTRATGVGSMPGDDFRDAMHTVLGELGDLPYLPELPSRGVVAAMTGRTLALVDELAVDLQPAGWRLTDAPGVDHRRARSLLGQDLDTAQELLEGHRGAVKVQVTGPWTLAGTVERPRGDRVLGDHGARRDLAQALAEGVRRHVLDVRRRLPGADVIVQLDEPGLPAVLAGAVPTASGFSRHRSVTPSEAAQQLAWVMDAATGPGAVVALHCCAQDVPFAMLRETPVAALSFDLDQVGRASYDELASWVDSGRSLWLGVVPSAEPAGTVPGEVGLTRRVLGFWSALGHTDAEQLPEATITPTCGLAAASPAWARRALTLSRRVAEALRR